MTVYLNIIYITIQHYINNKEKPLYEQLYKVDRTWWLGPDCQCWPNSLNSGSYEFVNSVEWAFRFPKLTFSSMFHKWIQGYVIIKRLAHTKIYNLTIYLRHKISCHLPHTKSICLQAITIHILNHILWVFRLWK